MDVRDIVTAEDLVAKYGLTEEDGYSPAEMLRHANIVLDHYRNHFAYRVKHIRGEVYKPPAAGYVNVGCQYLLRYPFREIDNVGDLAACIANATP